MKRLISVVALTAIGFTMPPSTRSIGVSAESTPTNAEVLEDEIRMSELSKRVEIETFVSDRYLDDGVGDDDDADILYPDGAKESELNVKMFTKYDKHASEDTLDKIKNIHIPAMNKVQDGVGKNIVIRSAARSKEHERRMGRSGKSQHVYSNGLGAVDVSLPDYSKKELNRLENVILDSTNYKRIARYDTFIHVDHKENRYGGRAYYRNTKQGWVYVGKIKDR